jgi:hypothetical protein
VAARVARHTSTHDEPGPARPRHPGGDLLAPLLPAGEPVEQLLRKAQFFVPGGTASPVEREKQSVRNWRVAQLRRLGVPGTLAEVHADSVDWHQVARLMERGCPPRLALRIAG